MDLTLQELQKKLQIAEDIEEIKKLQYRYVNCLILTAWDEIIECFADSAEVDIGGEKKTDTVVRGKAAIGRLFKEGVSISHLGKEGIYAVHPIINVTGDTASGTWLAYFMHLRSRGQEPLLDWMQGFYECRYVKQNGQWKFSFLKWRARLRCSNHNII
jgi:hypothetical protein